MAEGTNVNGTIEGKSPAAAALHELIQTERQALDRSLDRLGGQVRETLDWRRQATRHRGKLLAAGGGLLLAGAWRWRQSRKPRAPLAASLARAADTVNHQAREGFELLRRHKSDVPRLGWMRHVIAPLAMAAVRAALTWRESQREAQAGGGTAGASPEARWGGNGRVE